MLTNPTPGQPSDPPRETPALFLEVRSGKTRFPFRPVTPGRYLIGSAKPCDLRLGGVEMPQLHSMIVVRDDEVFIERVASEPELFVNETATDFASLSNADQFEIGDFRFAVHSGDVLRMVVSEADPAQVDSDGASMPDESALVASELSAAELVGRIEQDESLVREHEAGVNLGIQALARAIMDHVHSGCDTSKKVVTSEAKAQIVKLPTPDVAPDGAIELPDHLRIVTYGHTEELKHVTGLLESVVEALNERADEIAAREQALEGLAATLTEQQGQLAEQVNVVVEQITALNAIREPRRRSA